MPSNVELEYKIKDIIYEVLDELAEYSVPSSLKIKP
jgi:hypothetical protein